MLLIIMAIGICCPQGAEVCAQDVPPCPNTIIPGISNETLGILLIGVSVISIITWYKLYR